MVSSERLGQNHEGMKSDGETGHQSFRRSCWRLIVRLLSLFMLGGGSIRDVADAAAAVLFYVVYFTVTRRHLCAQHFESRANFPLGTIKYNVFVRYPNTPVHLRGSWDHLTSPVRPSRRYLTFTDVHCDHSRRPQ